MRTEFDFVADLSPLGDGIEDVQVSRDGSIWVSFFDEGICTYEPPEGGLTSPTATR